MRIVHIAFKYGEANTGGAAIASTRLHKALLDAGIESHYVCVKKAEDGVNVHELPVGWKRKLFFFLTKAIRGFWKLTAYRKSIPLNIVPLFGLEKLLNRLKPDLVHVHWLNADVASFEQIARLPYPIVFNLHDLFIINAINPYPYADRRFIDGFKKINSTVLERWLFKRKREMVARTISLFIGPSRWVCSECSKSIIGNSKKVFSISNIISREFFSEIETCNQCIGSNRKFKMLYGAYGGRSNRQKGYLDLEKSLRILPEKAKDKLILYIYGEESNPCLTEGVETVFLGKINSPWKMVEALTSVDVFLFPSRAETQGMAKVEALLCGAPVITFNRTACAEGVHHKENGWIADDGDIESYSNGIKFYCDLWNQGGLQTHKSKIRDKALIDYSEESILQEILKAYHRLIMI